MLFNNTKLTTKDQSFQKTSSHQESQPFLSSYPEAKIYLATALSIIPLTISDISAAEQPQLSAERPPLQLAQSYQSNNQLTDFLVSEKLDGVRAYWDGTNLYTRSGNRIKAPAWFLREFPVTPLDGELWIARSNFEILAGILRKKTPVDSDWRQIKYMVFDLPADLSQFESRYKKLSRIVANSHSKIITLVAQQYVSSNDKLQDLLSLILQKGGEGLMLHRKNSLYQARRNDDLQKLKPFNDDEARVISYIPGKGKYIGLLGAIEVINSDGKRFKIGSGFSLEERINPPPLNSIITYRYRGKTKYNTPRFATFLRRHNQDIL